MSSPYSNHEANVEFQRMILHNYSTPELKQIHELRDELVEQARANEGQPAGWALRPYDWGNVEWEEPPDFDQFNALD